MAAYRNLMVPLVLASLTVLIHGVAIAAQPTEQKAVLVTGASSGIGRTITERLSSEGYYVYAGARSEEDIDNLSAMKNVTGVRLDVTVQSDIDAAVELVKKDERILHALINNAGVVVLGLLAETAESDLDFVFDVNVYGPYRMVKAFAPMLIQTKGNIINISSMAGIMSPPAYGAYSMSKHAIEAFSDTLAYEFGTVGVSVSAIEPGPFQSNAVSSSCARQQRQDYDPAQSRFPELAAEIAAACEDQTQYPKPDPVADVVLHVLESDSAKARYLAPSDPRQAEFVARSLIRDVVDLSTGQSYRLSRDELVALLDATLADAEGSAGE
jgi:NAD(P)-dependent dehydrogenase (short-subunit alcohol dehydrogenase family)